MSEQNRKTLKSFYCRDYLWELFEVMARDLGCSMDYLINESMRHYARSRNYSLATGRSQSMGQPDFVGPPPTAGAQPAPTPFPAMPSPTAANTYPGPGAYAARPGAAPTAPPPVFDTHLPTQSRQSPFGAPPASGDYFPPPPAAPAYQPRDAPGYEPRSNTPSAAPTGSFGAVPPLPYNSSGSPVRSPPVPGVPGGAASPMGGGPAPGQPVLFMLFQGQKYRIEKEKFIIGRGSQMTDLTIRDGNISRKHAAVIFRSGKYFIKDLDSTNGIDYQGSRIDSKKIEEGDIFHVCDYEMRFTYR